MEKMLNKYYQKLINQRLCCENEPILAIQDAEILWNRESEYKKFLTELLNKLPINSILFSKPTEPYWSIINFLVENSNNFRILKPRDTETRTFFHDIPIVEKFVIQDILNFLKKRKAIIIKDKGILTYGIVSLEQAFVSFSSVCFSTFVMFFSKLLDKILKKEKCTSKEFEITMKTIQWYLPYVERYRFYSPGSENPQEVDTIITSIQETGKYTVYSGLVDSYFGNISFYHNGVIYISQTSSSLDELEGMIDPCPIDNSATYAITASSEFPSHRSIYLLGNDIKCILHGHPKFTVIRSLACEKRNCVNEDSCHKYCNESRFIEGIPIIPGEVGTGKYSISSKLPQTIKQYKSAIVFGHGIFCTGSKNFHEPFKTMIETEIKSAEYVYNIVKNYELIS